MEKEIKTDITKYKVIRDILMKNPKDKENIRKKMLGKNIVI